MFTFTDKASVSTCDGVTRRDFLSAGTLSAIGLTMPGFAKLKAEGRVDAKKSNKSCIMIFNLGAPSQQDLWDMKPDAPSEIRGPFKPIRTKSDAFEISEILPMHAKIADKFSLVRSCYHTAAAVHDTGHQMMQTGRLFTGGVITPHGQDAGFLGKAYDPFVLNANPSEKDFKVPDLLPPKEISEVRLERRRQMRELVDSSVRHFEYSEQAKLMDSNFEAAYRIMTSTQAREAFDLTKEPQKVRERYGMNRFGQSCLLARRLVERGVRFVTVNTFITVFGEITWDIHGSKPFTSIEGMRDIVAPMYDQGYSALIEDLFQRGMLDDTMVTCLAEFGRTPKINPAGGRDHWPNCWTVNFAGGGLKGGEVIGKSDDIGGYPTERPVAPKEIVATIYQAMGIDLHTELPGPQSRTYPVVDFGTQAIKELFA